MSTLPRSVRQEGSVTDGGNLTEVSVREIPGVKPAVLLECLGGGVGQIVAGAHHAGAVEQDLAVVGDLDFGVGAETDAEACCAWCSPTWFPGGARAQLGRQPYR